MVELYNIEGGSRSLRPRLARTRLFAGESGSPRILARKLVRVGIIEIEIGIAIGIEEIWGLDTRNWMSIVFR